MVGTSQGSVQARCCAEFEERLVAHSEHCQWCGETARINGGFQKCNISRIHDRSIKEGGKGKQVGGSGVVLGLAVLGLLQNTYHICPSSHPCFPLTLVAAAGT